MVCSFVLEKSSSVTRSRLRQPLAEMYYRVDGNSTLVNQ